MDGLALTIPGDDPAGTEGIPWQRKADIKGASASGDQIIQVVPGFSFWSGERKAGHSEEDRADQNRCMAESSTHPGRVH